MLTGILVRFEGDKLVMAATDSYRLAVKETALERGGPSSRRSSRRGRSQRARTHRHGGRRRSSSACTRTRSSFQTDDTWLTTRRIDGQFPNYKQLLPEAFEHEVPLPRSEVLEVVRRVAVMVQRNSPLRLRFAEGELTVSAQTQDVGEARGVAAGAVRRREPLEIGFNAEFLREGIESMAADEITLKLISPLRPARDRGRRRGPDVPDHADPARRLTR